MANIYVIGACALIATTNNEKRAESIYKIYTKIHQSKYSHEIEQYSLRIHYINLLEYYYIFLKAKGKQYANEKLHKIKQSNITIATTFNEEIFHLVGRIKATYHDLSLADAFALAETIISNGTLITFDKGFKLAEKAKEAKFFNHIPN